MIGVERIIVGQLATNCYLVFDEKSRETVIVDPGDDAEAITNRINDLELIPTQIIATHGHFDHILAVNELKLVFRIPFLLSKGDAVMLDWFQKSAINFLGFDPGPAPIIDQYLEQEVLLGKFRFIVLSTPGHTPGGVCLYLKEERILFSGDTIFAEGAVGRTDYPYCDRQKLVESIRKLMRLPGETLIYPGHGRETTIREERDFHLMQK